MVLPRWTRRTILLIPQVGRAGGGAAPLGSSLTKYGERAAHTSEQEADHAHPPRRERHHQTVQVKTIRSSIPWIFDLSQSAQMESSATSCSCSFSRYAPAPPQLHDDDKKNFSKKPSSKYFLQEHFRTCLAIYSLAS
jgi:hypothetical protein